MGIPHTSTGPIGVFDSGYGGLTILKDLRRAIPDADFIYLGDNARAPYGARSFDVVYEFTRQAVWTLFEAGCPLVILACNTASAKALRTIQQRDLPQWPDPSKRVLGVIRPTVEILGQTTASQHVGLLATPGTIASESYLREVENMFPSVTIHSHACPMWVPLVENRATDTPGAEYFIKDDLEALFSKSPHIDTLILGCTHYPLLLHQISKFVPPHVKIPLQGAIVANSLIDYLNRHPEMARRISRSASTTYLTTENPERFGDLASYFMGEAIEASHVSLTDAPDNDKSYIRQQN